MDANELEQIERLQQLVAPIAIAQGQPPFPVTVNVYDMITHNRFLHSLGCGVYHSGVEILGQEYCYGTHPYSYTGVYKMSPRQAIQPFVYRTSVVLGYTQMTPDQIADVLQAVASEYIGDSYHILDRNCNHFSSHLCQVLCGQPIPTWINRAAGLGSLFPCVIPALVASFDTSAQNQSVNSRPRSSGSMDPETNAPLLASNYAPYSDQQSQAY